MIVAQLSLHLLNAAGLLSTLEWGGRILVYVLVLGALIVFHELGHMIAAKRAGVTVAEFAFGFGPRLFAIERGGTLYTINLLPLGGFCRMVGEDTAEDGSADPGNFQHKPLYARFLIILAGPVFNFVLAAVLFAVIAIAVGQPTVTDVIDSVQPHSPAAAAGFAKGDEIRMLNGQAFRSADEMVDYIHARPNTVIAVDLLHDGTIRHLRVKTEVQPGGMGAFGFQPAYRYVRMDFWSGV
ncbi:MAG TPA: site-2 protease family protein, partial [Candidatus Eremiobacteraceae bacterium]|nr:site-2 protease family protein [Candidatus Eremiobacteraceae bacterium]